MTKEVKDKTKKTTDVLPINEELKEEVKATEPTVEQLRDYINQLLGEYNRVLEVNKQLNVENVIKRLNLLFKVVEMKNQFPREFVVACKEEIVKLMTIEEQPETSDTTEKPKA